MLLCADIGNTSIKFGVFQLTDNENTPICTFSLSSDISRSSDEYEFLPYNDSLSATVELIRDCEKEELAENVPQGTVFAKCADGDTVILTNNGDVVRFSHEMFEIIDHWESVAQFVFDAITESE